MLKEDIEVEALEEMQVSTSNNVVVPIFKRLPLVRLTERTCKWPLGDPLKDDFCFCGNDLPDNTPYCDLPPEARLPAFVGAPQGSLIFGK